MKILISSVFLYPDLKSFIGDSNLLNETTTRIDRVNQNSAVFMVVYCSWSQCEADYFHRLGPSVLLQRSACLILDSVDTRRDAWERNQK